MKPLTALGRWLLTLALAPVIVLLFVAWIVLAWADSWLVDQAGDG